VPVVPASVVMLKAEPASDTANLLQAILIVF